MQEGPLGWCLLSPLNKYVSTRLFAQAGAENMDALPRRRVFWGDSLRPNALVLQRGVNDTSNTGDFRRH
jgi:hypothetical protein